MATLALVLAGGGVAGIAWETGFLLGVEDESPGVARALLAADALIGTSAGATVAAQVSSGLTLADLFEIQTAGVSHEIPAEADFQSIGEMFAAALADDSGPARQLQLIGEAARRAPTVEPARRRAVIEARLPSAEWPARRLLITVTDTDTGELVVLDRDSGVGLVDAVAASCAVPGVWPVVTIGGRRCMDGGVGSSTNAQLAAGSDAAVVLVPVAEPGPYLLGGSLDDDLTRGRVATANLAVYADADSVAAMGPNPLAPESRRPSAIAGRSQGRRQAAQVAEFLASVREPDGVGTVG
ncbi:patatin-like phospholipase family protein [Rhodococcus spelaei]|uniref:Patatin-like phospholipase family protein n=1 Tax=Rhodococcus spelaei TaxID=2546320 RepID=A0A541BQH7_9NOCA|nr:patatin-like phospholipase family protein [Rhodococcus spelaei]TQF74582.1 patatin-like phospholipase family protein [Rhodococcus spelaei]